MIGTQESQHHRLIASDRVEGSRVFNKHGQRIGTIKRLMIDKTSGNVAYAVMTIGGLIRLGKRVHILPWSALRYDPVLGGYRTNLPAKFKAAPPTEFCGPALPRVKNYDVASPPEDTPWLP
ncbi:PRC-barrel domain-containing protein [Alsobacter sp. SYSU BS001988]